MSCGLNTALQYPIARWFNEPIVDDFYFRLNGDKTVVPEFSPTDLLGKIDNLEMALFDSQIREKKWEQRLKKRNNEMLEGTATMILKLVNLYKKDVQYPPEESQNIIKNAEKTLNKILTGRYGRLKQDMAQKLYDDEMEEKEKPRLRILTPLDEL